MLERSHIRQPARLWTAAAILTAALGWSSSPAAAQSRTGSQAASSALFEGSGLVVAGSAEILSATTDLVVTGIGSTASGVRLVLRPVAEGVSEVVEVSADLAIEVSQAAWDAAEEVSRATGHALHASLVAVGDIVETVAISVAEGSVVGSALVVGDIVLAIIAFDALEAMIGHGEHSC